VTTEETAEQVRERAALYAIGALPPDEAAAVERRLAAGDARYVEEVAAFRAVADDLAYAASPQTPRPAARDRVLARVAAVVPVVIEQQGLRFVRSAGVDWKPSVAPGIEYKLLRSDAGGRRTGLVRMAPGSAYPKHRHPEPEEVYVLEGDLLVNGILMQAGDYCTADLDSVHESVISPNGCVFVVRAGDNEFF
jgi:anti-sigma factor ChrR (cupin superfamily)